MLHLQEGPFKGHIIEDIGSKKPSTCMESNRWPRNYEACALPLCYNCCPQLELYLERKRKISWVDIEILRPEGRKGSKGKEAKEQ